MTNRLFRTVLTLLTVLALWQALVTLAEIPRFILPGPLDVAEALWSNRAILAENTAFSALNLAQGLALGLVLGIETALLLALSDRARRALRPVLVFAQAVPVFALAPVLTLWLGFGALSKIVMVALVTYFPIASALFDGLMRLPQPLEDLARQSGASRWRSLIYLRLPNAKPAFFSGLRLAVTYAPLAIIIGEWVGASKGLGHLMLLANGRGQTPLMFASLIVLAIFSLALWLAVDALARREDRSLS
ncbi:ABC transporter permease [Roseovarius aestuariivivens]|uniref:ABC transporter permease n=1 Tax=Roseovarius aestuariivivens TaxID=1888910 RepID=UPI001080784E|nr:ABC transporter permease [Roseovarius aestuariivivens]